MNPVEHCLVRLRSDDPRVVGLVMNSDNVSGKITVVWLKTQMAAEVFPSQLTSGFDVGQQVNHYSPNQREASLGTGTIIATRTIAGAVQHLVDLWPLSERRWLPWQSLQLSEGVDSKFKKLPAGDGTPLALRLRNLAYALSEWDITSAGLQRLEIDPLPHQIYLVNRILSSGNLNWLIADDVGLGKTIEVGLLLTALVRRRFRRFLIVTPAGLTRQWEEELRDKFFFEDFVIYGENVSPETASQWKLYDRVIVSMDRAKHELHLPRILEAQDWDLVIIDEAHRLSRREYGYKFETTERYALARALRPRTQAMILLSGTPHQGKDDMFRGLLELLRPGSAWRRQFNNLKHNPELLSGMIIRNRKADVTDQHGDFIFRGKTSKTVEVHRTEPEKEFEMALVKYIREGYAASLHTGVTGTAIGFVMTTFRKLAASSLAAITKSLARRLRRLEADSKELVHSGIQKGAEVVFEDERFVEGEEDAVLHNGGTKEFFAGELEMLRPLVASAKQLASADSKIVNFFNSVLPQILDGDPKRKVLIFTEYRTTQDVLAKALSKKFGSDNVTTIHGGQNMKGRRAAVDDFNERIQFLVSTEAGGEGLNLHRSCNVMVNFDLPWNPMRLVQRVGRLYRYGQTERVVVFNMKTAGTLDQEILGKMYDRLETIAADMVTVTSENREGLVEDILGQLVGTLDISGILEDAATTLEERSQERIEEALQRAKEAAEEQDLLLRHASGFNPATLEGRLQPTIEHLKAFCESMMESLGIVVTAKVHGQDIWDLKLPESLQERLGRKQNVRISFDRSKAGMYKAELLDSDHPLLITLLEEAKKDSRGAAASIHFSGGTIGYTALVRWLDESGVPTDSQYVVVTRGNNGEWKVNDHAWLDWLTTPNLEPSVGLPPTEEDAREIEAVIDAHLRAHGTRSTIGDIHFPISGFVSQQIRP